MAWTSPLTAVANAALTAAQWNASVRDNLNMTAPALASTASRWFITTGSHSLAERDIQQDTISSSQTTTSTSFTDLGTTGPGCTLITGEYALVCVYTSAINNTNGYASLMSYEVSEYQGSITFNPTDARAISSPMISGSAVSGFRCSAMWKQGGNTPGNNVFWSKYRVQGGTGTFQDRNILVQGL